MKNLKKWMFSWFYRNICVILGHKSIKLMDDDIKFSGTLGLLLELTDSTMSSDWNLVNWRRNPADKKLFLKFINLRYAEERTEI